MYHRIRIGTPRRFKATYVAAAGAQPRWRLSSEASTAPGGECLSPSSFLSGTSHTGPTGWVTCSFCHQCVLFLPSTVAFGCIWLHVIAFWLVLSACCHFAFCVAYISGAFRAYVMRCIHRCSCIHGAFYGVHSQCIGCWSFYVIALHSRSRAFCVRLIPLHSRSCCVSCILIVLHAAALTHRYACGCISRRLHFTICAFSVHFPCI